MLGILEAQVVGGIGDGFACGKLVLGELDDVVADMLAGGLARGLLDEVAEVVGAHAELVGAILHRRKPQLILSLLVVVIPQQGIETLQEVVVLQLSGQELAVVEPLAIVEQGLYEAHHDAVLVGIVAVL